MQWIRFSVVHMTPEDGRMLSILYRFNCVVTNPKYFNTNEKNMHNSFHPNPWLPLLSPPRVILAITPSIKAPNNQLFLYLTDWSHSGVLFCKLTKIGNPFIKTQNLQLYLIKIKSQRAFLLPFLLSLLLLSPGTSVSYTHQPTPLQKSAERCLGLWIHFLFIAQMNDLRAIKKEECNPCVENWVVSLTTTKRQQGMPMCSMNMQEEARPSTWKKFIKNPKKALFLWKKMKLIVIKIIDPNFTHKIEQKANELYT